MQCACMPRAPQAMTQYFVLDSEKEVVVEEECMKRLYEAAEGAGSSSGSSSMGDAASSGDSSSSSSSASDPKAKGGKKPGKKALLISFSFSNFPLIYLSIPRSRTMFGGPLPRCEGKGKEKKQKKKSKKDKKKKQQKKDKKDKKDKKTKGTRGSKEKKKPLSQAEIEANEAAERKKESLKRGKKAPCTSFARENSWLSLVYRP